MQSLSKSKLPLKITKIFMVFVLFFSLMIQKPKETHAFPLALLLPAISNPASVTALLGVIGLGAVGSASSEWYLEKRDQLEQTAISTIGLMSKDMKQNFEIALNNLQNGFTTSLDLSKEFIDEMMNLFTNTFNATNTETIALPTTITKDRMSFNNIPTNFQFNYDGSVYINSSVGFYITTPNSPQITFRVVGQNEIFQQTVNFNTMDERNAVNAIYTQLLQTGSLLDFVTLFNQYVPIKLGLTYAGVTAYPSTESTSLELDNVGDYVTDTLLLNQNKLGLPLGINDLVGLKTNQGVPLYVDNVGQVVLRDGRPFEGDLADIVVSHRVPTVTDVAGTLTPTVSTDFGMVNVKTGEIVIPNPNPPTPNPPNNIKPQTTKPLTGIQRFLPAAVVIVFILFLKAIVFYAIRLFDFILTLPLTPSKPINNYAFQWFMDAKILGIQVYDTVLAFAMFAFSLTIYKVIRRIW